MSVITIMEEDAYDSLSQAQKHIMLKNGAFEFDSFKQCSCYCGHSVSDHFCCLSKELCLCEKFLDKESKVTIPKKLPRKKEDVLQKETGQLDNYIQTLARI
jgi:hypothetical protein